MASDELDSETLHEDTAEEDKGQEVQQLRTELESYKSQMEDQNSMIMDMEEQLSLLREENKSLKQTVLTVSQEKEQQVNQILRLNAQIAEYMVEKDTDQAELEYDNQEGDTDTSSTPSEITEALKKKIEEVIRDAEPCDFDLRRVKKAIHRAKRMGE